MPELKTDPATLTVFPPSFNVPAASLKAELILRLFCDPASVSTVPAGFSTARLLSTRGVA